MYYASVSQKQKEIFKSIQNQLERDRIEIKYIPSSYRASKKKNKKINLEDI